ncbi:hypothetical protein B0H10DRAFT_2216369 [Mycena sp. CBHHK59/15]|nr:hypothetical protein B0H10DRAFT_2216369 [Mycena sp. CBHHK59/15]
MSPTEDLSLLSSDTPPEDVQGESEHELAPSKPVNVSTKKDSPGSVAATDLPRDKCQAKEALQESKKKEKHQRSESDMEEEKQRKKCKHTAHRSEESADDEGAKAGPSPVAHKALPAFGWNSERTSGMGRATADLAWECSLALVEYKLCTGAAQDSKPTLVLFEELSRANAASHSQAQHRPAGKTKMWKQVPMLIGCAPVRDRCDTMLANTCELDFERAPCAPKATWPGPSLGRQQQERQRWQGQESKLVKIDMRVGIVFLACHLGDNQDSPQADGQLPKKQRHCPPPSCTLGLWQQQRACSSGRRE